MPPISRFPAIRRLVRDGPRSSSFGGLGLRASAQQLRCLSIERVTGAAKPVREGNWYEGALRKLRQNVYPLLAQGRRATLQSVSAVDEGGVSYLSLRYDNVKEAVLVPTLWLRDACQGPDSVTPSSGQKRFRTSDLPANPAVKSAAIAGEEDGAALTVEWAGTEPADGSGPIVSRFDPHALLCRLAGYAPPLYPAVPTRRLWDRARLERELRPVSFADWTAGQEEFWRGLYDLARTGILIVDGVPETEAGVLQVAQQIGHVQPTFYGETFDVVSKPEAENVAYTDGFLCLHHDLMYLQDPPHIQLLHTLKNSCDGGESLFSDSVRAAVEMCNTHPEHVRALATTKVQYHYERNGHYYYFRRPVVSQSDPRAPITETSWSPPFQNAFRPLGARLASHVPPRDATRDWQDPLQRWHAAAQVFSDLVEAPQNQFEVKMEPGQCVLFNNRRVLHGRRQFNTASGHRHLRGTYLGKQPFLSKVAAMVREHRYAPTESTSLPITPAALHSQEKKDVARLLRGEE